MGILSWLNDNIARPILKGGQWLGQKVVQPTMNWLKNNVPVAGSLIQAAEPLTNTFGKLWNASADQADANKDLREGRAPKKQRTEYPTAGEVASSVAKTGVNLMNKYKGV